MSSEEELLTFQRFLLAFDTPAYLRRARQVEAEWIHLVAACTRERDRRLEFPRLRLAQLIVSTQAQQHPERLPVSTADRDQLLSLHQQWQPELRSPVAPCHTPDQARQLLQTLIQSFERFNRDWEMYITRLDLAPLNAQREKYNEYYVLEKECAVRSSQTAREGFEPMAMVTPADLLALLPRLPIPVEIT